jgi:DNA-binding CsgD family transcriptional regulator
MFHCPSAGSEAELSHGEDRQTGPQRIEKALTFAVLVFRKPAIREALEGIVAKFPDTGESIVVDTPCAARKLLRSQHVDAVVVGREYIEDVPGILEFCPDPAMTMSVLMVREPSAADHARARLNDIDLVVDSSGGASLTLALIVGKLSQFSRRTYRKPAASGPDLPVIWVGDKTDVEIVEMIAAGYSDREIADAVCLNHQTVRNHVSRILCESGARNRTHLASMYLKFVCAGFEPFDLSVDARPPRRSE